MQFFNNFVQLIDDVKAGVKEVKTLVKETKEEFSEVMTDGFVEIVIKKNSNYQTSSEKRDKAYSVINKAKKQLKKRITEMEIYAQQTEKAVKEFYNYKSESFEKILNLANEYTEVFYQIDGNSNLPINNALISQKFYFNNSEGFSMQPFSPFLIKATISPVILDLIEQKHRVEKADSFLKEAHLFEEKVEVEIAKLNSVESKLNYIHQTINEEKTLLTRLYEKVNSTIFEVKKIKNKTQLTIEETDKIFELTHIIELLRDTMDMVYITKSLNIDSEYKERMKLIQSFL